MKLNEAKIFSNLISPEEINLLQDYYSQKPLMQTKFKDDAKTILKTKIKNSDYNIVDSIVYKILWPKNKNIVEASWSSFSFNLDNSTNFLSSINFKYYYIRSIKFYESIKKKISNYAHITLRLNETIISITNKKNYYEVITNKSVYLAKNVYHPNWDGLDDGLYKNMSLRFIDEYNNLSYLMF